MCGIAGFLGGPVRGVAGQDALRQMTDAIRHRGPDDSGQWLDDAPGIALGHRRLSILDLSPEGHQPMASNSGRFVIVFNGEIYNFAGLRDQLAANGQGYRGHSDTEVMLAAFEHWGIKAAVQRFAGMFAFALWDRQEQVLHLVRDRTGEKPLYAGWSGNTFLFGSELKALRAHPAWNGAVDRDALSLFLRHSYVPGPWSIYQGIRKVEPGTILSIPVSAAPGTWPSADRYWSPREIVETSRAHPAELSDAEAVRQFEALLGGVIRDEMVADVPVGAFLSGGIDSSTIVALMQANSRQPVRTFTIGFHEAGYDEAGHAKAVAAHLGTIHTELYVTAEEARAVIPKLPSLYDEPFGDSSQIPTHLVAQLARRSVTVSLSGDGGDELLGGYDRYSLTERIWRRQQRLPAPVRHLLSRGIAAIPVNQWNRMRWMAGPLADRYGLTGERAHKLAQALSLSSPGALYRKMMSMTVSPDQYLVQGKDPGGLLARPESWPNAASFLEQMMVVDLVTYLPDDILAKVDRATMGVSLESRAPLLDHRVVEFAFRLPLHQKMRDGQGKWLLRQVLERHVPRSITDRPKMGFGVPIASWLRGPLRSWMHDLLEPSRLRREQFFAPAAVGQAVSSFLSGDDSQTSLIWNFLMFQAWLQEQSASIPAPVAGAA